MNACTIHSYFKKRLLKWIVPEYLNEKLRWQHLNNGTKNLTVETVDCPGSLKQPLVAVSWDFTISTTSDWELESFCGAAGRTLVASEPFSVILGSCCSVCALDFKKQSQWSDAIIENQVMRVIGLLLSFIKDTF